MVNAFTRSVYRAPHQRQRLYPIGLWGLPSRLMPSPGRFRALTVQPEDKMTGL